MALDQFLAEFCQRHRLSDRFLKTVQEYYIPLADRLSAKLSEQTFVLGINGCQGSGKSTLAEFIRQYLSTQHDKNVVSLSIDDIYLTKKEREYLGRHLHPLLQTRGVPGTHDVDFGLQIIQSLKYLDAEASLLLPRFDKLKDDRCKREHWGRAEGKIDLVILEGWCVGSQPEEPQALDNPVNDLERKEDPFGKWRQYANRQLAGIYAELFDELDALLVLKAPSFECVFDWRLEQERKLAASLSIDARQNAEITVMSEVDIGRFVQHYERITRHNLDVLPQTADVIFELGIDREISSALYRSL